MPAALVTTKRKFHKLLDSISNASSASLPLQHDKSNLSSTTLPSQSDPPSKKLRIARPASARAASTQTRPRATISLRPTSVAAVPASARPQEQRSAKRPPNFAPWDRAQFLSRLKTFRHVDKWTGKPDKINEVEWAKRGWSCVGKESVGCVGGCSKEVVIILEDKRSEKKGEEQKEEDQGESDLDEWREEAQKELVERYSKMISTAHEESCLWRIRGCDDTIQRLPVIQYPSALEDMRSRHSSLLQMASELPDHITAPETLDHTKTINQISSQLSQSTEASSPSETRSTPNGTAILLALFGWQAEENHIAGLATCGVCFRRLGLWLFKPSSEDSSESSMNRLDVVAEHRDYCPWINALSQNGGGRRSSLDSLTGWETLLRTLATRLPLETSGQNDREAGPMEGRPTAPEYLLEPGGAENNDSEDDEAIRDRKDKERWAKLKRISQVFRLKKEKFSYLSAGS